MKSGGRAVKETVKIIKIQDIIIRSEKSVAAALGH